MTPAINLAIKSRLKHQVHEYNHDPAHLSFGLEAAEKLNIEAGRVFKTLVVKLNTNTFAVAVLPVSGRLSMKQMAKFSGQKKAAMADKKEVERLTGYVLGGVSPLGQKKRLQTFIDVSAQQFPTIYISAGRRGLEIELTAQDLAKLLDASFADLCQA